MESDQEPSGTIGETLEQDPPAIISGAAAENQDTSSENKLLDAIKEGDFAAVKRCLDENADINSIPSHEKLFSATPLSWAVCYGREEIAIELLNRGADFKEKSSDGLTPLNWAVRRNQKEIAAELLKRLADTERKQELRDTPLWRAVANGFDDCVRLLLENGADVNATNNRGVSILHLAVAKKYTACVEVLLEKGADVNIKNAEGVSVLHQAVKSDDLEISKVLLEALLSEEDRRAIRAFSFIDELPDDAWVVPPRKKKGKKNKRSRSTRISCSSLNERDDSGETPLLRAVLNRSQEMVRLLVSAGATLGSFDMEGDSELARAIYDGSEEIAKLLVKLLVEDITIWGAIKVDHKNCTGMTAFLWAAYKNNVSIGKRLISCGADISGADEDGMTALHFAAERGYVDFAEMLFPVDSNSRKSVFSSWHDPKESLIIEARESHGHTPLLSALSSPWYREHYAQSKRVVQLLLDHGARPDAKNKNKQNALHLAVLHEFTGVVEMLLPRMIFKGVCAKDQDGNTPLHLASRAAEDSETLVELILNYGHMPHEALTTKNLKGETALDLAIGKRNSGVLQRLVNYGIDVRYSSKFGEERPTVEDFPQLQLLAIEEILRENEQSWTLIDLSATLNWSARNGRENLMRKILSTRDYVTENLAKDVIYWAAVGGQSEMVSWLFQEYGEYVLSNITGSRAIQAAAINGHDNTVRELIRNLVRLDENTFSVGKKEEEGFQVSTAEFGSTRMRTTEWTPLHWVVNYEPEIAIDIIRHMLMNGVDPEAKKGGLSAREMAIYWGRSPEIRSKILALLQAPLRVTRKAPQLEEPFVGAGTAIEEVCKRSPANIIDFCTTNGSNCTLESKSTVYDIIYKRESGPGAVMKEAREVWSLDGMDLKHHFRWIHLPANNWTWAEDLARRIYSEPTRTNTGYTRVKNFMQAYRREHKGKPFCRFMYPALSFEREEFPSAEGDAISTLHQKLSVHPGVDVKNRHEKSESRNLQNLRGSIPHNMSEQPANENSVGDFLTQIEPIIVDENSEKAPKVRLRVINKELTRKENDNPAPDVFSWGENVVVPDPFAQENKNPQKKAKKGIESWGVKPALSGIKMSICIPFLTFHSVSGHRTLRQTVRLIEEAKRLQVKKNESRAALISPVVTTEISLGQEERRTAERVQKNEIRKLILELEVKKGLELLENTKTNLYEYFNDRWSQIKDSNEEERLRSLRVIHLTMRRNVESNAPGIMEWLERLSDAISICSGLLSENEDPKYELLLENYLNPQEETGLHPSRTLDQYYYSALADTSRRDVDQVVRRYQARAAAAQCRQEAEQAVISKEQEGIHSVGASKKTRKFEQSKLDDEKNLTPHWEDDPDAQICMVDQLWLWVLDDETIVTCFPPSAGPQSKNKGGVELLDRIREHIRDDTRPHISSVYHLATIITSLSVRFVEECQLQSKDSLLHTFASSIGTVADEEVKCFENFRLDISQSGKSQSKVKKRTTFNDTDTYREKIQKEIQERVDKVYRERYPDSKTEDFQEEVRRLGAIKSREDELDVVEVDIQKEIMLLEEIKDIRDELNILKSIFEDQRNLLNKLFTLVRASHLEGREATQTDIIVDYYQERSDINLRLEKVHKMEMDAKITYDSINHLLDLKQKNANLSEAVQARKQAEQSAQQGRTILVFTIVTIVFLPLSFLSSFYSLKIESFPRQGNDSLFPDTWIFSRIFGTSAALAIPLIILAVYVNDILKYYQKNLQRRISSIWIGFKGFFVHQPQATDSHKRKPKSSRGKREKWGLKLLASRKKERLPTIEDGKNR